MAGKPKKQLSAVDKFKMWYDRANKIAETTKLAHSEAYVKAANTHLLDGEGNVDLEKLEKEDVQKDFTDTLYGHLFDKAKKFLKSSVDKGDQLIADRVTNAYSNITYNQLHTLVRQNKKNYSIDTHEQVRDNLIKKVRQELVASAGGHLQEKDKYDLYKAIKGADKLIDIEKVRLDDLVGLYGLYKQSNKNLTRELIIQSARQSGEPEPIYLKKAPEE